jgi:preprotein translocase subunit SecE
MLNGLLIWGLPSKEKQVIKLSAHPPKWCAFLYLEIRKNVKNVIKKLDSRLRGNDKNEVRKIMALNPAKFIREVRTEVGKVTWPTRKETIVSTIMVLVLAFVAALFFLAVDGIFAVAIRWILGLGQ